VILIGFKLKEKGAVQALQLLQHWTGQELQTNEPWDKQLVAWQKWYAETYPDALPAEPPHEPQGARWKFEELAEIVAQGKGIVGDAPRGAEVFVRAQCAKCHRCGEQGQSLGPDLTTVAKRFTRKEILESIYFPSHVVSSQYASKQVVTGDGRQFVGLVLPGGGGDIVIVQASGEKVTLLESEVEEMVPSRQSAMPSGLLDPLEKDDIADLLAYLSEPLGATVASESPENDKR
jgi:putative heme-binding domain-containing protein